MSSKIPFNKPGLAGDEFRNILGAIASGRCSGDGEYTKRCQNLLDAAMPGSRSFLTTSCTHALELTGLLLGIGEGDEVIVPSFTFVSTPNAYVLRGARPVFADVRPDTLNLDETRIERLITPRTKAIIPVHYAGVACEMDAILEIAARRGVAVVEDNAHGLFGSYDGRPLGTFGCMSTLSFHETKNFSCGEGGALVINDPSLVDRAEILREKGTNRSRFFRGMVDKYTWVDVGSSYLPSDILAAFLLAQLEKRREIQRRRERTWRYYSESFQGVAPRHGFEMPVVPERCGQSYHMFYMMTPSLAVRQALMAHLKSRGIGSAFHYVPLHLSEMGQKFGGYAGQCPVTEDVSDRILRLPFFNDITELEQEQVVEAVFEFWGETATTRRHVFVEPQRA